MRVTCSCYDSCASSVPFVLFLLPCHFRVQLLMLPLCTSGFLEMANQKHQERTAQIQREHALRVHSIQKNYRQKVATIDTIVCQELAAANAAMHAFATMNDNKLAAIAACIAMYEPVVAADITHELDKLVKSTWK
jgi:hypothetical protein